VKPPRFRYVKPTSLSEAVDLMGQMGDRARLLAGGQSIMPLISMRLIRPDYLVDINGLEALAYIRSNGESVSIGALTRQRAVEDSADVGARVPLLSQAIRYVGHMSIRNRGTVGGSVAHGDPAAEIPAVLLALGAAVTANGPKGSRRIPLQDLYRTAFTTTLAADEILTEVSIPAQPRNSGSAVLEVTRRHGDFAIVGVAATLTLDADERVEGARLVAFGTGSVATRLISAEETVMGEAPSEAHFQSAGRAASAELQPLSDIHASDEYRRWVAATVVARALPVALDDARARQGGGAR
jgi:carbon-monoxide dehydrogenase medium subunit